MTVRLDPPGRALALRPRLLCRLDREARRIALPPRPAPFHERADGAGRIAGVQIVAPKSIIAWAKSRRVVLRRDAVGQIAQLGLGAGKRLFDC